MKIYKRNLIADYFNNINLHTEASCEYVPFENKVYSNKSSLKPVAFYLPQFYQTEMNDKNWGKGYTEWTAVTRAKPNFYNHYQPHLPDSFGYYNLKMTDVLKKQIELAKQYGVYGFCFYFYNFGDRTELRQPLDNFFSLADTDFPFCIFWANENWTRKWDGGNDKIILEQKYDSAALTKIINDACKYFKHRNYIKVSGKPLFIIYNPSLIPNLTDFAENTRKICRKNGIDEIHLSFVNKHFNAPPQDFGFDSVTEFPPHNMPNLHKKNITKYLFHNKFQGDVFDIEDYVNNLEYNKKTYTIFRSAFPSWDNSARRQLTSHIFYGSSPQIFSLWLKKIMRFTIETQNSNDRFFFINAWNEWGEGAHLEPDKRYGYAYLQALRNALNGEDL